MMVPFCTFPHNILCSLTPYISHCTLTFMQGPVEFFVYFLWLGSYVVPAFSYCTRENPKNKWNLFIKFVYILACLNFSHLQRTLHLMQYLSRHFHCSTQFLNSLILMSFSAIFVSLLPHLENFSHSGKKKFRVRLGE